LAHPLVEEFAWAIELLLALSCLRLGGAWVARRPARAACCALALAAGVAYVRSRFLDTGWLLHRKSMRAVVHASGTHAGFALTEVPLPPLASGMLLVRVRAASLSPSNYKVTPDAWPVVRHFGPYVVGYEVAGEVEVVGEDCDADLGDKVWGFALFGLGSGGVAEFATLSCGLPRWLGPLAGGLGFAKIPDTLSFAEAASLPVAGLTGLAAYDRSGLASGQQVLVLGASGGCGFFGVTLALARGAQVTGVCSTRNLAAVTALGAEAVDYTSNEAMAALQQKRFDVIYDTVSSSFPEDPDYEPEMRPLLKPGGTYVAIGPPRPLDGLRSVLDVPARWLGLRAQREGFDNFLLFPTQAAMEELSRIQATSPRVPIEREVLVNSTEVFVAAMERLKSRRTAGKIVVSV